MDMFGPQKAPLHKPEEWSWPHFSSALDHSDVQLSLTGLSYGPSLGSQQLMMTHGPVEEGRGTNQRSQSSMGSLQQCLMSRARAVAVEAIDSQAYFVGLFIRCPQLMCTQVRDYETCLRIDCDSPQASDQALQLGLGWIVIVQIGA